jgi:8-amino-7-oxononanoate synthase
VDTGRSFIFDTGLAPPCAGAALAALEILAAEPDLGLRCRENALRIAAIAGELGLETCAPAAGVVSITLGRPQTALAARSSCERHGVRVGCFRPPSVPAGRSCLRLAAHATLTERDFTVVSRALAAVRDDVYTHDPAGRRWP